MNAPPCCRSPAHVTALPSWAHALFAIALIIAVAWIASICWAWMRTPLAIHACGRCTFESCGYCQRAARDRKVKEYSDQARERKAARDG